MRVFPCRMPPKCDDVKRGTAEMTASLGDAMYAEGNRAGDLLREDSPPGDCRAEPQQSYSYHLRLETWY